MGPRFREAPNCCCGQKWWLLYNAAPLRAAIPRQPMLLAGCVEAPHPRHGEACSQCLRNPRGSGCTECIGLGFNCSCVCGPHELDGSTIFKANRVLTPNIPEYIGPDAFRWSFFRPFSNEALQGSTLPARYNMSGWELDPVFEGAFARWTAA
eukprot:309835-Prymnesium_polylepis.1